MLPIVDFDANGLAKQVNAVQKDIATKKKVCSGPLYAQYQAYMHL